MDKNINYPALYARNEYGLLANAEYIFNEDGSVNWREMIKPEFLYVNKEWFEMRKQTPPTSIEGLKDRQLLILLGGIKELAKMRGFTALGYDVSGDKTHVVARCRMEWIGNYETGDLPVVFEDFANASTDNTDDFCHKFLETIACNRAFIRCVRNFLGVHIVGADEIDKSNKSVNADASEEKEDLSMLKPFGFLENTAKETGMNSFDEFVVWLRTLWTSEVYKNQEAKNWASYKDIPPKECRRLIALLKSKSKSD